jgi:hypothetical protein
MVRRLIREFLLQEEVFGAQAFVYHGSDTPPKKLIPALLNNEFVPGKGSGAMYGKGLYTVYDLESGRTGSGFYGDYLYKLKINLYGFISFDPDVTKLIYKRDLEPWQQAEEVGADADIVEKLKAIEFYPDKFTSVNALAASQFLRGAVKGIVYTGSNDGRCALAYDASVAVPVAWKKINNSSWTSWTPVDRQSIKPALRRSSTGEWEEDKYRDNIRAIFKKFSKLPIDQRIWKGDLDLYKFEDGILPEGLKVEGTFRIMDSEIKSLPTGLQVKKDLELSHSKIESLPDNLKVGRHLNLSYSNIKSLPSGLIVGRELDLRWTTAITSVPGNIEVESITIAESNVESIEPGIKIEQNLLAQNSKLRSLPRDLKIERSLDIRNTQLTSLPSGMVVGVNIYMKGTQITSLPDDLQVGEDIYDFQGYMGDQYPLRLGAKFREL